MGNALRYQKIQDLLSSSDESQKVALGMYLKELNTGVVCGYLDKILKKYRHQADKHVLDEWLQYVEGTGSKDDILRALMLMCFISPRTYIERYFDHLEKMGIDYEDCEMFSIFNMKDLHWKFLDDIKKVVSKYNETHHLDDDFEEDNMEEDDGLASVSNEKYVKRIVEYVPPTRIEVDEVTIHTLNMIAESLKLISVSNGEDVLSAVKELEQKIIEPMPIPSGAKIDYTEGDFLREVQGINLNQLLELAHILEMKGWLNIVGEPGTGKSTMARALAYYLVHFKYSQYTYMVSFNEVTAYEDFIGGLRQVMGQWVYVKGMFTLFCERAAADKNNRYVFIIDELNRANAAGVFGEVITAIENRDAPIHTNRGEILMVPRNVKLISTCNMLDSSTSKLDDAFHSRMAEFRMPVMNKDELLDANNIRLGTDLYEKVSFVYEMAGKINEILAKNEYKKEENRIGMRFLYVKYESVEQLRLVVKYDYFPMVERKLLSLHPNDRQSIKYLLGELKKEFSIDE